jgi:hypothetical protein
MFLSWDSPILVLIIFETGAEVRMTFMRDRMMLGQIFPCVLAFTPPVMPSATYSYVTAP